MTVRADEERHELAEQLEGAMRDERRQAAEQFRSMWRDLQRFGGEIAAQMAEQENVSIEAAGDVRDEVTLAAAEDELDRHAELREALRSGFVDRLLEMRQFAGNNQLEEAIAFIDLKLSRLPRRADGR